MSKSLNDNHLFGWESISLFFSPFLNPFLNRNSFYENIIKKDTKLNKSRGCSSWFGVPRKWTNKVKPIYREWNRSHVCVCVCASFILSGSFICVYVEPGAVAKLAEILTRDALKKDIPWYVIIVMLLGDLKKNYNEKITEEKKHTHTNKK